MGGPIRTGQAPNQNQESEPHRVRDNASGASRSVDEHIDAFGSQGFSLRTGPGTLDVNLRPLGTSSHATANDSGLGSSMFGREYGIGSLRYTFQSELSQGSLPNSLEHSEPGADYFAQRLTPPLVRNTASVLQNALDEIGVTAVAPFIDLNDTRQVYGVDLYGEESAMQFSMGSNRQAQLSVENLGEYNSVVSAITGTPFDITGGTLSFNGEKFSVSPVLELADEGSPYSLGVGSSVNSILRRTYRLTPVNQSFLTREGLDLQDSMGLLGGHMTVSQYQLDAQGFATKFDFTGSRGGFSTFLFTSPGQNQIGLVGQRLSADSRVRLGGQLLYQQDLVDRRMQSHGLFGGLDVSKEARGALLNFHARGFVAERDLESQGSVFERTGTGLPSFGAEIQLEVLFGPIRSREGVGGSSILDILRNR